MAHVRKSRPDSGLDFLVKSLKRIPVVPSSLGSGGESSGGEPQKSGDTTPCRMTGYNPV